jgi:hypothetical protein
MEKIQSRDPGWKKFGSVIRYKLPGSATEGEVIILNKIFVVKYQGAIALTV